MSNETELMEEESLSTGGGVRELPNVRACVVGESRNLPQPSESERGDVHVT
jgi:hypothetical protein